MLELENIQAAYEHVQILHDVNLSVSAGEVHCIMGRNGAGKTTTLKAIMGLVNITMGKITIGGRDARTLPAPRIPALGVGYIPQGRRLFSELSVAQNMEIGLMVRNSGPDVREKVLDIIPRLRERLTQRAHTLSGGEQQMLATARALCLEPELLLLDEPTEGLQPSMINQIREVVLRLAREGVAIVLVEQRIDTVLALADRVTFLENGYSKETVSKAELASNDSLLRKYVGV